MGSAVVTPMYDVPKLALKNGRGLRLRVPLLRTRAALSAAASTALDSWAFTKIAAACIDAEPGGKQQRHHGNRDEEEGDALLCAEGPGTVVVSHGQCRWLCQK